MFKRFVIVVGGVLVLLGGIGYIKFQQIQAGMAQLANFAPPPATVSAVEAHTVEWRPQLTSVGTLTAIEGIALSAEVSGTVDEVHFKSGQKVSAGQLLLTLNNDVEKATLASYKAQAELAKIKFERNKDLFKQKSISEIEFDQSSADLKVANAMVQQTEANIAKKVIRAPFSGTLGIRQFSLGQYVKNGEEFVTLQDVSSLYADFAVPEQFLPRLYDGQEVLFSVSAAPNQEFRGKVTAIEAKVDEQTRNVSIRAEVPNDHGQLHPGMYADIRLLMKETVTPVVVPKTAIVYSPFGDAVFVVDNDDQGATVAKRVYIQVGEQRGNDVAIVSGLEAGMQVVDSGTNKLENGTKLILSDAVRL